MMTKAKIESLLKNPQLSSHEREMLLQQLHYMQVEGIKPPSAKRPKKNYAPHKPKSPRS